MVQVCQASNGYPWAVWFCIRRSDEGGLRGSRRMQVHRIAVFSEQLSVYQRTQHIGELGARKESNMCAYKSAGLIKVGWKVPREQRSCGDSRLLTPAVCSLENSWSFLNQAMIFSPYSEK